jgi:RND family efflux transporter MFP subunit
MKFPPTKLSPAGVLLVMAALTPLACSDGEKIDPNAKIEAHHDFHPSQTATVSTVAQPIWYEAVGTVEPALTIGVAPQVNGRILEMLVEVGQKVQAGTVLFRIDDRTIQTQVAQAQSGIRAATAAAEQAAAAKERVDRLFAREAATAEQVEAANSANAQAQAAVTTAKQALVAAQTYLSYTEVVSPVDGTIAERSARAGDLALPGHPILKIHGGVKMDFVAAIRESKIEGISVGSEVQVDFPTLTLRVPAVVHELHPAGDPATRSFTIKASLPTVKMLRPGMYGKLMLKTGELEVTVIPQAALSRVGQLETVMVQTDGGWQRRFVRVGNEIEGGYFEILSGLSNGETIGWIQ